MDAYPAFAHSLHHQQTGGDYTMCGRCYLKLTWEGWTYRCPTHGPQEYTDTRVGFFTTPCPFPHLHDRPVEYNPRVIS